jgi:hypothetical protein
VSAAFAVKAALKHGEFEAMGWPRAAVRKRRALIEYASEILDARVILCIPSINADA